MNLRQPSRGGHLLWRTEGRAALCRYLGRISAAELARRLSAKGQRVSRQSVSNWARGISRPKWAEAAALASETKKIVPLEAWEQPPKARPAPSQIQFDEARAKLSDVTTSDTLSTLPAPLVAALADFAGGRSIIDAAVHVVSELQLASAMAGALGATKPPRVA